MVYPAYLQLAWQHHRQSPYPHRQPAGSESSKPGIHPSPCSAAGGLVPCSWHRGFASRHYWNRQRMAGVIPGDAERPCC